MLMKLIFQKCRGARKGRRQKAEGRRQKAEGRRQKAYAIGCSRFQVAG